MDKKGEKKDPKAAAGKAPAGKDAKPAAKEPQKPAAKEEKKEETAEERRLREEREELKAEKKLHKKEHHRHMHEAAAGGNIMDDLGKKQIFKKYSYRGHDLKKLIDMNMDELSQQLRSRQRRKLRRKWERNMVDLLTNYLMLKSILVLVINPQLLKPISEIALFFLP